MINVIFLVVTYMLALYGFFSIFYLILREFIKPKIEDEGIKLVIIEKNQESRIEGILDNVLTGDLVKRLISSGKITVLDMGSEDGTVEILRKLKEKYQSINLVHENERHVIFEDFE